MQNEPLNLTVLCVSVCLSVSTCSRTTGPKPAHKRDQRVLCNKRSKINLATSLKRRRQGSRKPASLQITLRNPTINFDSAHAYSSSTARRQCAILYGVANSAHSHWRKYEVCADDFAL